MEPFSQQDLEIESEDIWGIDARVWKLVSILYFGFVFFSALATIITTVHLHGWPAWYVLPLLLIGIPFGLLMVGGMVLGLSLVAGLVLWAVVAEIIGPDRVEGRTGKVAKYAIVAVVLGGLIGLLVWVINGFVADIVGVTLREAA